MANADADPSYRRYLVTNSPGWLVDESGKGEAFLEEVGRILDDETARMIAAVKCDLPGSAPADALPYIGDERGIDRGPGDTDDTYAERLRRAWETWPLAGSPTGVLLALWEQGYTYSNGWPVIVQQNGLAHFLAPVETVLDPSIATWPVPDRDDLLLAIVTLGGNVGYAAGMLSVDAENGTDRIYIDAPRHFAVGGYASVNGGAAKLITGVDFTTYLPLYQLVFDPATISGNHPKGSPVLVVDANGDALPWWMFDSDDDHTSRWALLLTKVPLGWDFATEPSTDTLNQIRRLGNRWRAAKALWVSIFANSDVLGSGTLGSANGYLGVENVLGWPVRELGASNGNLGGTNVTVYGTAEV